MIKTVSQVGLTLAADSGEEAASRFQSWTDPRLLSKAVLNFLSCFNHFVMLFFNF